MTDLYHYVPSRETDLLLAQLWARMDADGDLDNLFSNPQFSLSMLLEGSKPPLNELIYTADESGIWLAMWFTPIMGGALMSAYIRPDCRPKFRATLTFKRVLQGALQGYGTILGITRHEHLLPVHYALGYTLVGRIPAIFPGGRDGYMLSRVATAKEQRRWHSSPHSDQPLEAVAPPAAPVPEPPRVPEPQELLELLKEPGPQGPH